MISVNPKWASGRWPKNAQLTLRAHLESINYSKADAFVNGDNSEPIPDFVLIHLSKRAGVLGRIREAAPQRAAKQTCKSCVRPRRSRSGALSCQAPSSFCKRDTAPGAAQAEKRVRGELGSLRLKLRSCAQAHRRPRQERRLEPVHLVVFALQRAGNVKPTRARAVSVTHPRRMAASGVNG
jgi:hypothetical protein